MARYLHVSQASYAVGVSVINYQKRAASRHVELADVISHWLGDASERTRIGENGSRVVGENRGALERLFALIEQSITSL